MPPPGSQIVPSRASTWGNLPQCRAKRSRGATNDSRFGGRAFACEPFPSSGHSTNTRFTFWQRKRKTESHGVMGGVEKSWHSEHYDKAGNRLSEQIQAGTNSPASI